MAWCVVLKFDREKTKLNFLMEAYGTRKTILRMVLWSGKISQNNQANIGPTVFITVPSGRTVKNRVFLIKNNEVGKSK